MAVAREQPVGACGPSTVLRATAPTVTATNADHNGLLGIAAPDDTLDGGGNTARGNGQADRTGVVCA